jgi:hypothetical protein
MPAWGAIQYVTSGLTLVAFVAAAVSWLLKSRQDSVAALIKRAAKSDLPGILDTYLRGAKIDTAGLSPDGKERIALASIGELSARYRQNTRIISTIAILVAAIASLSIVLAAWTKTSAKTDSAVPGRSTTASVAPFRTVIEVINLEEMEDRHESVNARLSVANTGPNALLVNYARLGVFATSMSDGSTITKWFDLLTDKQLPQNAIEPMKVEASEVSDWQLMGNTSSILPSFRTYFFKFMVQVEVTDGKSGKTSALDIDMPRAMSMNCLNHRACISVYDLNLLAGNSPRKSCTAIPAGSSFTLDCNIQEQ